MNRSGSRIPTVVALVVGVAVGWACTNLRPKELRAGSGDRAGDSIVATGPVIVRYDEAVKAAVPLDAVYLLDYEGGRLVATVPTYRQSMATTHIIDSFVERDLVADFKLDLDTGPRPRFLMTTGSLGPYTAGWAPLTCSRRLPSNWEFTGFQLAQSTAKASRSKFELIELRSYAKSAISEPAR